MTMNQSEMLCLKWQDFQDNNTKTFNNLRNEPDFSDVTLVSKDNYMIKAHRVILSRSSTVFNSMLNNIEHINPVIYMRGIKSKDLSYHGEANIAQDDLQEFMNLAQELHVKGLENTEIPEEVENSTKGPILKPNEPFISVLEHLDEIKENLNKPSLEPKELVSPVKLESHIQNIVIEKDNFIEEGKTIINDKSQIPELDERVKTMIDINPQGFTCTVCGHDLGKKRREFMVSHIETKHMSVAFPCVKCGSGKLYNSRKGLAKHMAFKHRNETLK